MLPPWNHTHCFKTWCYGVGFINVTQVEYEILAANTFYHLSYLYGPKKAHAK